MATSSQVLLLLKSKLNLEDLGGGLVKFTFGMESNRSQLVFVQLLDSIMVIRSPFARIEQVTAERVIEANDNVWGVTKLNGDLYVLTHVVLLDDADANEIMLPIALVAKAADELEKKLGLGDRL